MNRRTALRNAGVTGIVTLAGCLGDPDPPQFAFLAFENEYDDPIRFDVRVTSGSAGTSDDHLFDRVVKVPSKGRRAFELFEKNERYSLTVTSPHERIDLDACSDIFLTACGQNPTVFSVDYLANASCSIAGCGA